MQYDVYPLSEPTCSKYITVFSAVLVELQEFIQYVLHCIIKKVNGRSAVKEEQKQMDHLLWIPLQATKGKTTDNVAAYFSHLGPTELLDVLPTNQKALQTLRSALFPL